MFSSKSATEPPVVAPPFWDPIGLTLVRRFNRALADNKGPTIAQELKRELTEKHGYSVNTWCYTILGSRIFGTCDVENIKAMLAGGAVGSFDEFAVGDLRRALLVVWLGDGIFSADGPSWQHMRALLRPCFNRSNISATALPEKHCTNLVENWLSNADDSGWLKEIDLQPIFSRFTLDMVSEYLLGESLNGQLAAGPPNQIETEVEEDEAMRFARAFKTAHKYVAIGGKTDWWKPVISEYKEACKVSKAFVLSHVQQALAAREDGVERHDQYVLLDDLTKSTTDPDELTAQILHLMVAGQSTTALLLGWLFYLLSLHRSVFDTLRDAVLEQFGTFEDPYEISFAELKQCQYLQWCINETLRLFPPLPSNHRQAQQDTTLPRGGGPQGVDPIFIPKGSYVEFFPFLLHRDESFWGEDASEFRPERWEARKNGWEFVAFSGGPRICLGQQLALTWAGYAIVRLVQRFDSIEPSDADEAAKDIGYSLSLTMTKADGVWVNMHKAD